MVLTDTGVCFLTGVLFSVIPDITTHIKGHVPLYYTHVLLLYAQNTVRVILTCLIKVSIELKDDESRPSTPNPSKKSRSGTSLTFRDRGCKHV